MADFAKLQKRLKKDIKINEARRSGTLTPFTDGYDFGDITKTILGTGTKALTRFGEGSVKAGENILDTFITLGSSKLNPFIYLYGYDPNKIQENTREFIKRDLTSEFKDSLGYNNTLSDGRSIQQTLDESSLIKPNTFADDLIYGIGNIAPSILLANTVPTGATSALGKLGTSALQSLPIATSAFGGGVEEAYQSGASREEANAYGLLNAATEIATEWAFGGIPGTKSAGYLDDLLQKGMDKKITNEFTKELAKYGYRVVGEAGEEALAEIMNPLIKNLTYSDGEKVDWNNVLKSAAIGGIVGGIFNLGETTQSLRNARTLDTMVDTTFDPNDLTIDEGIEVLNNLKNTTTDNSQLEQLNSAIDELTTIKQETTLNNPTISDIKQDIDTQLKMKQRKLSQLESRNELLRTESEAELITKTRNEIAELRRQKVESKKVTMPKKYNIKSDINTYEKVKNQKQILHLTNNITDILNSGTITGNLQVQNKNAKPVMYGNEGFVFKPEALDYSDKLYYGDRGNDFTGESTDQTTDLRDFVDNVGTKHLHSTAKVNNLPLKNTIDAVITYKNSKNYDAMVKLAQELNVPVIENKRVSETNTKEKSIGYSNKEDIRPNKISDIKDSIASKVLKEIPKAQLNTSVKKTLSKDIQTFISKTYPVEQLAEQVNNPELRNKLFDTMRSQAIAQNDIFDYQTDVNGKKVGESLLNIWQPIEKSGLVDDFSLYEYAKHGIARYQQDKTLFGENITDAMLKEFVSEQERLHPEFKEWDKNIKTWQNNIRDYMQNTGLLSSQTRELLESMYPDYVRVYRDYNNGKAPFKVEGQSIRINSPIKTAKGGDAPIIPLKEAMARQTLEVKNAGVRNVFGNELYKTLKGEQTDIESKNIKNNLIEQDGSYAYIFYKDGKQTAIPINKEIYDALTPSRRFDWEDTLLAKGIQTVSKAQRGLLTQYNPIFAITNFFKDIGDAPFNSRYAKSFFPNLIKAGMEIRNNGELWKLYKANGGMQNTYFDYEKGFVEPKKGIVSKIANINELVEQMPRLAEFMSSIQNGNTVSQAMYDAAEVTTNFSRGSDISRALSRNGFNFFNASLQGFYKQYNNLRGAKGIKGYVNLLLKATAYGITPSLLNHLLLSGDDEYEELNATTKDNNYIIKIGNTYFKIPKGRAMSIIGSAARRALSGEGFEDFGKFAIGQVGPTNPLTNNFMTPIIAINNNKNWFGGDIVPKRLQDLPPSQQYDEGTTSLAKAIGGIFNFSPMKIDYLLDQYTGVAGDIVMPMMTEEAEPNFIVAKFVVDTTKSNKKVSELYDEIDKLTEETYKNPSENIELRKSYLNGMKYYVNMYYSQIREVQSNPELSDAEKTEQTKILREEINNLAKQSIDNSKDIKTKTVAGVTYKQIGLTLYKYDKENDKYTKVNTATKGYKNVMGAALQSKAINQEIDASGTTYVKIGNTYYTVNDDGTYKKLKSSTAINKAKIKLGY